MTGERAPRPWVGTPGARAAQELPPEAASSRQRRSRPHVYPAFFWLLVPSKGTRLKSSNSEQTSRLLQCICPFRLTVQKNLHEPSLFSQECSQTSPASVPKPRWARRRVPAGRGRVPAHAALRSRGGEGQPEARHCRGRRGPRSRRLSPRSWPSPRASADGRCVSHAGAPAPPSGLLGSARRGPQVDARLTTS